MQPFVLRVLVLLLTAAIVPLEAQTQAVLSVCEGSEVRLGQTKQEVRNILAACCRFQNAQFPLKNGKIETPNQITYENKVGTDTCSGSVLFDKSEKLVSAERILGEFGGDDGTAGLANAIARAIDSLVPGPAVKVGVLDGSAKFANANIEVHTIAGPTGGQNTFFIEVMGRFARFEFNNSKRGQEIRVTLEIGDLSKGDLTSVPVK